MLLDGLVRGVDTYTNRHSYTNRHTCTKRHFKERSGVAHLLTDKEPSHAS